MSAQHNETAIVEPTVGKGAQFALTNVLHLVNGEHYAGAERVQDLLGLHLPRLGFEVGYVCVKPGRFARVRQSKDAPVWEVPVRHPWHRSAMREIARIARRQGCEMLHSHTPRSYWAAAGVGRLTGLPVVHTMHSVTLSDNCGLAQKMLNRYTLAALRRADLVIAVSPAVLKLAEQRGLGGQRWLIRNGVPTAGPLRHRPPPSTWTVGTVSLMRPCKGIEVLIRALAHLRKRNRPVRVKAVGRFATARYERGIRSLVAGLGVGEGIEFVGFTDDVPAQLEQMDLFALPSVGPEGLPMVVLEAMAYGLPIIGSDVPGISDVVRHGVDGRLFAAGDDRALADAIDEFMLGNCDWQQIRRAVHERQRSQFAAGRMARQTADAYRRLLSMGPLSLGPGRQ